MRKNPCFPINFFTNSVAIDFQSTALRKQLTMISSKEKRKKEKEIDKEKTSMNNQKNKAEGDEGNFKKEIGVSSQLLHFFETGNDIHTNKSFFIHLVARSF